MHKCIPNQTTKCKSVTKSKHALNNSRKLVKSIEKLWKIKHGKVKSEIQCVPNIYSKSCVKDVQTNPSFKQCTTNWSYQAIFKNKFKNNPKLIIQTSNENPNDPFSCVYMCTKDWITIQMGR